MKRWQVGSLHPTFTFTSDFLFKEVRMNFDHCFWSQDMNKYAWLAPSYTP